MNSPRWASFHDAPPSALPSTTSGRPTTQTCAPVLAGRRGPGVIAAKNYGKKVEVTGVVGEKDGKKTITANFLAAPVLTSIGVTPASISVNAGGAQPFTAIAYDQNNNPLSPQPSFTWSVNGGGAIDGTGLFTAGASAGGAPEGRPRGLRSARPAKNGPKHPARSPRRRASIRRSS